MDYELSAFNIKKLANNGRSTRVLLESKEGTMMLEITGPCQSQQHDCDFKVNIEAETIKRDVYNLLKYIVLCDTYPKQQFTLAFEGIVNVNIYNMLSYALILHGVRMKDSFSACSAQLNKEGRLQFQLIPKEPVAQLQLVYSIHSRKIIQASIEGVFSNDDYSQMISGCVSGCKQTYQFLTEY